MAVIPIMTAAVSYINRKADGFSGDALDQNAYPAELEKVPELQDRQSAWGYARGYVRPLVPFGGILPPFGPPQLSKEYRQLQEEARITAELANLDRFVEDQVYINGRVLPGIFQGMRLSGGIYSERVTVKARPDKKVKGKVVKRHFQVDNGDRPISGSIAFLLLDDEYSTAKRKAREFISIITDWEAGQVGDKEKIPRVFTLGSNWNGEDWSGPYNFTRIKIRDYSMEANTGDLEGQLNIEFMFEQYDALDSEGKLKKPKTPVGSEGAEPTEMEGAPVLPPGGDEFAPV